MAFSTGLTAGSAARPTERGHIRSIAGQREGHAPEYPAGYWGFRAADCGQSFDSIPV
jgi:hypothetical protein